MPPLPITRLLIALLVLVVFHGVVGHDFIFFDDHIHVYENPHFNPLSWSSLGYFWTHIYERLYIPASYTVYGALVAISRLSGISHVSDLPTTLNPHIFHFANLALHIANAIMAYEILRWIAKNDRAAAVGAMLFALHPIQVEAVAWVAELRGLLAAAFGFGAILAYLRYSDTPLKRRYVAATLLAILAILSKPSAVVIALLALVIDRYVHRRPWRTYALELGLWLVVGIVVAVVTGANSSDGAFKIVAPFQRTFVAADAIVFFLCKLFVPLHLSVDYGRTPQVALADPRIYAEWLVPPAIAIGCWLTRKRWPLLSLGALVSLIALFPVLGLVPFSFQYYSTVADRYAYVAMLGPAMLVAKVCARVPAGVVLVVLSSTVGFASQVAQSRVNDWKDSRTLMRQQMTVNPDSPFAHFVFGHYAEDAKDYKAALLEYQAIIRERPDLWSGHYDAARCYAALGDLRNAETEFLTTVQLKPDTAHAYQGWGRVLVREGKRDQALAEFEKAKAIDPALPGLDGDIASISGPPLHVLGGGLRLRPRPQPDRARKCRNVCQSRQDCHR